MKFKKTFIIMCILICITSIACIHAEDANDTQIAGEDTTPVEMPENQYEDTLESGHDENQKAAAPIVITSSNFGDYFTGGEPNGNVDAGSTLDFQGSFTGESYSVNITKPVNIISSTKDAEFNGIGKKESTGGCFHISGGGSGTNMSSIRFVNSAFYVTAAGDVSIDSITMVANETGIGATDGFMCIKAGSRNVTIKNSYFENGGTGAPMIVIGYSYYCTFDSNEVFINGKSGNGVYITTYVPPSYDGNAPTGNRISNNYIHGTASGFCIPLVVAGTGNIIESNRIDYGGGYGISSQSFSTISNNSYTNNVLTGGCSLSAGDYSQVSGNRVEGAINAGSGSRIVKNQMTSLTLSKPDAVVEDNNITGPVTLKSDASNTTLAGNTILSAVTVKSNGNTIHSNVIDCDSEYGLDLTSSTGNEVYENLISSNGHTGNDAIKANENNNIHDNGAVDSFLSLEDISIDYGSPVNVTATVRNALAITARIGDVELGVANHTIEIPVLNVGTYTMTVATLTGEKYNPVSLNVTLTVNRQKTEISAKAVTARYNAEKYLTIALKDDNGNPLRGADITVNLKGTKTYTTDENGQVKISTKGLAPKAYTAKIMFKGNDSHYKSSSEVKVTVKKAKPKLTAAKKSKKGKYSVTLKDNAGKPIKKAKLTLKIKGKTFKATTNKKGKAVFKLKKLKKGKYKAKITYKGNNCYNKLIRTMKITVK